MASSFSLLVTLLFTLLYCSHANLITNVCSKASNASLCTQLLKSDPRSSRADLRGLGQIVLEKSTAATREIINITKHVDIMHECVGLCVDSIDALNDCSKLLNRCGGGGGGAKCKADMGKKVAEAVDNIVSCDDLFIEGGGPFELSYALDRAVNVINVFPVIVESL